MRYRCMTNNPLAFREVSGAEYFDESLLDLLHRVEREILGGYKLMTHPLTGSIRPDITPYKTVLLSPRAGEVDMESVDIIQKALDYAQALTEQHSAIPWNEEEKSDFQLVDCDIIRRALERAGLL